MYTAILAITSKSRVECDSLRIDASDDPCRSPPPFPIRVPFSILQSGSGSAGHVKFGINGFGRIGRLVFRAAHVNPKCEVSRHSISGTLISRRREILRGEGRGFGSTMRVALGPAAGVEESACRSLYTASTIRAAPPRISFRCVIATRQSVLTDSTRLSSLLSSLLPRRSCASTTRSWTSTTPSTS